MKKAIALTLIAIFSLIACDKEILEMPETNCFNNIDTTLSDISLIT